MIWVWTIGLIIVQLGLWLLNFVSLPGNWGMVSVAFFYAWLGPTGESGTLGFPTVIATVVLAGLGELIEFAAAAAGARKAGGSRRAGLLAIVGSLIGSLVGVTIGSALVPVVGTIVGAVIFAGLGAMGGALLGEYWAGRTWDEMRPVGHAAFWGRLVGMAGKIACGLGIVVATVIGLLG